MKRVLVITYHFPPRPTIGSVRLGGLAKYLPRFGWEPVILTPSFPDRQKWPVPVVETAYRDVLADLRRRMGFRGEKGLQEQLGLSRARSNLSSTVLSQVARLARAVWCYPDDQRGWFQYALEAAVDAVRQFRCSAVLSSSSPVTAHLVAKKVKARSGLPWVADLRDLWTDNHYYAFPRLRWLLERSLEKQTLGMADALVTVSDPLAQVLRRRFLGIPVHVVLSGYDPDELAPAWQLSREFTVTYTGSLYDGKRDPTPLFEALAELASEGRIERAKVRLRFYGPDSTKILPMAHAAGVEDMVCAYPPVPRGESLRLQRESQVLLLLNWNNPAEKGIYTGKLFEYLCARRPVLALGGPRGVVAELLDETKAGVYACDREGAGQAIVRWWEDYVRRGEVAYQAEPVRVEAYSQVSMARGFGGLLDGLVR